MSFFFQLGIFLSLILLLLILLSISLFLIDNDPVEESEEESVDFDDNNDFDESIDFNDNIDLNDLNYGNINFDSNTDTMSEISELSNISSV